jgi:phosphomannomutase
MLQLKVGPQGIRGVVGQGLELGKVIDLVSAFAAWVDRGRALVVTRDTRPSSPMLAHATIAALSAAGCEVLDAGICPTAVAQREAARVDAGGLISITASHNVAAWNGLKLFGAAGCALTSGEGKEVLDLWHQGDYPRAAHDRLGASRDLDDVVDRYLEFLLGRIDVERIAGAGLRVVVDACNGAGAMVLPQLCRALGVELIPINCEPSGSFPHPPDPTAENMGQVAAIMGPVKAHVGFGLSSDCERVSLVTDAGEALGTPATLPLLAQEILASADEGDELTVVAGAAADGRVEQVAAAHGARVVRCGVGLQTVMERVALEEAALGGERSGGVVISAIQPAFDGLAAMVRLLQGVARAGDSRHLAAALPEVHTREAALPCPVNGAYSAVAWLRQQASGRVEDRDGVWVEQEEGWYYVRVSHTEPVIRVVCEARRAEDADELIRSLERQVRTAVAFAMGGTP